jgi:hypothetical protein
MENMRSFLYVTFAYTWKLGFTGHQEQLFYKKCPQALAKTASI